MYICLHPAWGLVITAHQVTQLAEHAHLSLALRCASFSHSLTRLANSVALFSCSAVFQGLPVRTGQRIIFLRTWFYVHYLTVCSLYRLVQVALGWSISSISWFLQALGVFLAWLFRQGAISHIRHTVALNNSKILQNIGTSFKLEGFWLFLFHRILWRHHSQFCFNVLYRFISYVYKCVNNNHGLRRKLRIISSQCMSIASYCLRCS
jgi:hypothetical protein